MTTDVCDIKADPSPGISALTLATTSYLLSCKCVQSVGSASVGLTRILLCLSASLGTYQHLKPPSVISVTAVWQICTCQTRRRCMLCSKYWIYWQKEKLERHFSWFRTGIVCTVTNMLSCVCIACVCVCVSALCCAARPVCGSIITSWS